MGARLAAFANMIDAVRAACRYGCVVAIAAACSACGGSAPGSAQSSCGGRGVPYIVDVPGDYAGAGWYDPGDTWIAAGDDSSDTADDTGSGDTGSGDTGSGDDDSTGTGNDSSGDDSSGDDSSGDDSSGDDSGGDGADATRIHVQSAAGSTRARTFAGDVCFSCPLTCTLSTPSTLIAGSSLGSSTTDFSDACAHAERDLRRWAHQKYGARIASCHVADAPPRGAIR